VHNNYYFLRQLSKALDLKLQGTVISECFSQNKEELVIRFETRDEPFLIKASLQSNFSCLSFPQLFHRAKKNSVDLFDAIIGLRVHQVYQFENERSFALKFNNDKALLFKMHGNRSNIILFENNTVIDAFKKDIPPDYTLELNNLHRTIDWSHEAFAENHNKLEGLYFTFGKLVWKYLAAQKFDTLSLDDRWEMIQKVRHELEESNYFITELNGIIKWNYSSLFVEVWFDKKNI
jgi:predicted ribosome quality control (RQC) complex YloA/Tae2 family protein